MFLGDGEVGKTSIITHYKEGSFSNDHLATLGLDYITKKHVRDNIEYNIKVWDTAGQERFRTMTQAFYKKAHGIVIVYDVTDAKSFKSVSNWIESILDNAHKEVAIILLGNKIDLVQERQVEREQAEKLAEQYKF